MSEDNRFIISPVNSRDNGEPSATLNGINVQYMPLFMKAAIQAGYIKDDNNPHSVTHIYNARAQVPIGDFGFSASYGINGYDSRYSTPEYSQSYRGSSPTYGINYTNGNWNAFAEKQKGQSPYFGINYFNRF